MSQKTPETFSEAVEGEVMYNFFLSAVFQNTNWILLLTYCMYNKSTYVVSLRFQWYLKDNTNFLVSFQHITWKEVLILQTINTYIAENKLRTFFRHLLNYHYNKK